jgi:hypothetical protein
VLVERIELLDQFDGGGLADIHEADPQNAETRRGALLREAWRVLLSRSMASMGRTKK